MDALLLDLDGVFYVGDQMVPDAQTTAAWLTRQGVPHLYVTNTTSRPRDALVAKLGRFGIQVAAEAILTPAVAAVTWLAKQGVRRVAAYVPEATRDEFAAFELAASGSAARVDAVVVGDLGSGWDFATMNRAFVQLMQEPQPYLIALGMTRYWRASDGLRLDAAPFVMALSHASDAEPVVLGKPAPAFFHAALQRLGAPPEKTCMVGDDLQADIGGAQAVGMRGVLVRTGKYQSDAASDVRPYAVLDSIAALPRWWQSIAGSRP